MRSRVPIHALTQGPKHHCFGFHDICPWDETEQYVLALETDFLDRPPRAGEAATIGVVDTKNNNAFTPLAETRAWNFQQGARQQWLPNTKETIIYNDYRDGKFVSVIHHRTEGEVRILPHPVYAIDPKGAYGYGLNFARLQAHGGYGYRGGEKEKDEKPIPERDGIWKINLETGERELIVSIRDVVDVDPPHTNGSEYHYITHVVPNPSGTRLACIHKWKMQDGGFRNRLMISDTDGKNIHHIPIQLSHFDWRTDTEILAWGRARETLMRLREKNIFKNPLLKPVLWLARKTRKRMRQKLVGDRYLLCNEVTRAITSVGVGTLIEDGHPSFSPDGTWLITDTYPDSTHHRTLILYNWETKKKIDLAKLPSLPDASYGVPDNWDLSEMRSDFHPRWNRSGTAVCFDSVHEGSKQMYVADLKDIVHS